MVERPTLAQVMLSRFVSLGHVSGSVLTARSLEAASDSVSPSVSLPLPCSYSAPLSLSLSKRNITHFLNKKRDMTFKSNAAFPLICQLSIISFNLYRFFMTSFLTGEGTRDSEGGRASPRSGHCPLTGAGFGPGWSTGGGRKASGMSGAEGGLC